MIHKSKYWNGIDYICECGRHFNNPQSLNTHFGHCEIHANIFRKTHNRDYYHPKKGCMQGWNSKSKEEINLIHNKVNETLRRKYELGELKGSFAGKHHSEETKEKIRSKALDLISNKFGKIQANFSVKACKYIDKLNKENNWKLQHALNGGEVRIGNYWVDGYDKINKIIFEYDERKHYISCTNILKQKDINRQNKILSLLGDDWTLYRYNENLNIFYKVQ